MRLKGRHHHHINKEHLKHKIRKRESHDTKNLDRVKVMTIQVELIDSKHFPLDGDDETMMTIGG